MPDKILIKACLNGGRGREESPNVPWTPAEVAAEAQRCYDAGACVVHMHARTPDGANSQDGAWYAEADALIRTRTPLLTNHTTIRALGEPVEVVLRHLREAPPDMCSLNMGHLISYRGRPGARTTNVTPNGYEDIAAILEKEIVDVNAVLDRVQRPHDAAVRVVHDRTLRQHVEVEGLRLGEARMLCLICAQI